MQKTLPELFLDLSYRNPSFPSLEIETFTLSELRDRLTARYYERVQRLHFHLVILYTEGRGRHEVDFVQIDCQPGTLIHVRPGQVQRYLDIQGLEAQVVFFTSAFLLPREGSEGFLPLELWRGNEAATTVLQLKEPAFSDIKAGFDVIRREYAKTEGSKLSASILRFQLQALLVQIDRESLHLEPESRMEVGHLKTFHDFKHLVEARYAEIRKAEVYARMLGCSSRTLNRATHARIGLSAKQFIDQRVALEAKRLLAHTPLSIVQISRILGFSEPTNFAKFFRREVGMLPGAFRDGYQGAAASSTFA